MCYRRVMEFSELVALLRDPGDNGLPDTIYDDLSTSYNDAVASGQAALAEANAAHESAIAEHISANESLSSEVTRLKAINFDLLTAVSVDAETQEQTANPTDPIGDTNAIDALFDK